MLQQIVHKIQNEALKSTLKTFKLCKSSVAAESGSRPGPIILFTLLLAARLHFRWSHHPSSLSSSFTFQRRLKKHRFTKINLALMLSFVDESPLPACRDDHPWNNNFRGHLLTHPMWFWSNSTSSTSMCPSSSFSPSSPSSSSSNPPLPLVRTSWACRTRSQSIQGCSRFSHSCEIYFDVDWKLIKNVAERHSRLS